jgi:hypothetical protein
MIILIITPLYHFKRQCLKASVDKGTLVQSQGYTCAKPRVHLCKAKGTLVQSQGYTCAKPYFGYFHAIPSSDPVGESTDSCLGPNQQIRVSDRINRFVSRTESTDSCLGLNVLIEERCDRLRTDERRFSKIVPGSWLGPE